MEITYKYLTGGIGSFGIKIAGYTYEEDIPGVSLQTTIPTIGISHTYLIEGMSVKLGWIVGNKITKRVVLTSSLYMVGTRNQHKYSYTVTDANGPHTDYYSRFDCNWGGEFEFFAGLRAGKNLIFYATVQGGVKPKVEYIFSDVVEDLPSYSRYAPVQGYGFSRFYMSASLGLSFMF